MEFIRRESEKKGFHSFVSSMFLMKRIETTERKKKQLALKFIFPILMDREVLIWMS